MSISDKFTAQMRRELRANRHKGSWAAWRPDRAEVINDLEHHLRKLRRALLDEDKARVSEHSADLANVCMKTFDVHGAAPRSRTYASRHQRLTWLMTNPKALEGEPLNPHDRSRWLENLWKQMQQCGLYSSTTNWFDCGSMLRTLVAQARAALAEKRERLSP